MLQEIGPRLANIALRAISLASKFLLVFVLAKQLTPAEVGLYGLFVATVAFSGLMIGGDYYAYAQRELLSNERERWSWVIQHHALALGLLYILLLPLQLLIFWFDLLPHRLLIWFAAVLILDHMGQEITRLLVAIGRPVAATWVLFLRMGAWVWPLLLFMWANTSARRLEIVLLFLVLGESTAVILGSMIVWRNIAFWRRWPVDVAWVRRGFRVGFLFLAATLCFKALTTVDRYVVETLAGPDLLGTYVLYMGLAMAVTQFIEPAITAFLYPRIVTTYQRGNLVLYRRLMRELAWSSVGLSIALALTVSLIAPQLLHWIEHPIYLEHIHLLWLLLAVAVIYGAGLAPHYGLYARGADRSIAAAQASSLIVFAATVAIAMPHAPLEATAYGLLASFFWIGSYKLLTYLRLTRHDQVAPVETKSALSLGDKAPRAEHSAYDR